MSRAKAIAKKYTNIKMDQQNVIALEKDISNIISEIKSEIMKQVIFSGDDASKKDICEEINKLKF
ncbi:hypothetical protein [Chondrinema litorale]|uniref:hypothetical protein n=1 Tax=Chondrinema litorale TaxID=2994555 RepID=UPI0025430921|nr:hypothetical protein [Chondrinema litorale]UZR98209.1 hypothetical protein OQ292_29870 [Chondrinema litorale]